MEKDINVNENTTSVDESEATCNSVDLTEGDSEYTSDETMPISDSCKDEPEAAQAEEPAQAATPEQESQQSYGTAASFDYETIIDAKPAKQHKKNSTWKAAGLVACMLVVSLLSGIVGSSITADKYNTEIESPTVAPTTNSDSINNTYIDDPSDITVNITASTDSTVYSDVTAVVNAVIDTVVGIQTDTGSGSGVIISEDGYIMTCNHVIDSSTEIIVVLHNEQQYSATVVGADPKTDIAILKIDASNLSAATLGTSSSSELGNYVVAVGNPLGELINSVSNGIISGLNRSVTIDGVTMTLMQTNAAVNPGNSGGGLFNMKGELIGIVNAKSTSVDVEGIGFAVPIDTAASVSVDLIKYGYVTGRPYLGITIQDIALTQNGNNSWFGPFFQQYFYRAQVMSIIEGGAAANAGIQVNDYILAIDDHEISSQSDITLALYEYNAGDTVIIKVQRNDQTLELTVVLGERTA